MVRVDFDDRNLEDFIGYILDFFRLEEQAASRFENLNDDIGFSICFPQFVGIDRVG